MVEGWNIQQYPSTYMYLDPSPRKGDNKRDPLNPGNPNNSNKDNIPKCNIHPKKLSISCR